MQLDVETFTKVLAQAGRKFKGFQLEKKQKTTIRKQQRNQTNWPYCKQGKILKISRGTAKKSIIETKSTKTVHLFAISMV